MLFLACLTWITSRALTNESRPFVLNINFKGALSRILPKSELPKYIFFCPKNNGPFLLTKKAANKCLWLRWLGWKEITT